MSVKISELKKAKESDAPVRFSCVAILKSVQTKIARNGSEFLVLEFGDNSGSFSTNCFSNSPCFDILKSAGSGEVFEVSGTTDFYQGRFSPRLEDAKQVEDVSEILDSLMPASKFDTSEMIKDLFAIIDRIPDDKLRRTVMFALAEAGESFYSSSAAVKMHHAYLHGLLEHTLSCARVAEALLPIYPSIDKGLVLAGVVLHDIGKIDEYSQGLVTERTKTGILHGHVVLGYRRVRRAGIKSGLDGEILERLEHIILSHQGELEWGAAVKASTPEAVFVSNVDYFDARMGAVKAALDSSAGSEFVDVPALKSKLLSTPVDYGKEGGLSSALDGEGE